MRRTLALTAGLVMAWVIGSGPAAAFQQGPAAPSAGASIEASDVNGPERTFDLELTESDVKAAAKSGKPGIPGLRSFGVLPNMNFGLELLYSLEKTEDQRAPTTADTDQDEIKIFGTVKRRF